MKANHKKALINYWEKREQLNKQGKNSKRTLEEFNQATRELNLVETKYKKFLTKLK